MELTTLEKQREFFRTGQTKKTAFRKQQLMKLYHVIKENETNLESALYDDLHKCETESFLTEIQVVTNEIKIAFKNLEHWQKPKKTGTTLAHFPATSRIYHDPYGVVLILAPWNYPVHLALAPLVGAIAGGNCCMLKLSKNTPKTAEVIRKIISETFPEKYIYCYEQGASYDEILLQKYDFIFFTGSEKIGKVVMEAASKYVTPLVLELGGKSPCIIEKTADLKLAAKRLAWGKYLNAGQTCVAPDYVLIDESIKLQFIAELELQIQILYQDALHNPNYTHIVNEHHFQRLTSFIADEKCIKGGRSDAISRCIEPTIFLNASFDDPIMQEEIFGPILPIISYQKLDDIIYEIQKKPSPLALYLFTKDMEIKGKVFGSISFGGGCLNDVVMHLVNHKIPFGGVGNSGIGNYHGHFSFETFTRKKGIVEDSGRINLNLRYPPYSKKKLNLLRKLLE